MIYCDLHKREGMCPECFGEAMIKIGAKIQGIKSADPTKLFNESDELSTWKARAERADKFREQLAMKHRRVNAAFTATKIQRDEISAERDTLKSLCEKLAVNARKGGYSDHKEGCYVFQHVDWKCNCGYQKILDTLTELQKL